MGQTQVCMSKIYKKQKQQTKWDYVKKYKGMYLFLLPAVLVCLVFSYTPMFGLIMAFQKYSPTEGFLHSSFVGIENFKTIFGQSDFYIALRNTLGLNAILILIGFPLPIILALMLNEVKNVTYKRISQTISYLPHFISWVVVAGIAYRFLEEDFGNVNLLLQYLGIEKIGFMREAGYFWNIFTTVAIWKEIGWNSIIFIAALATIDIEQYEAATIDGAGRFKKLLYITIPGIRPVVGLMFIFTIASIFGGGGGGAGGANFDAIYNMSNPMIMDSALTLDYYIYLMGIRFNNPSLGTAMGLILSLASFVILLASNKISKKISGYGAF